MEHLRDRRRSLARVYGSARDAGRVAAELTQEAQDYEDDFGPNDWRAVLYRALAAHDGFCDAPPPLTGEGFAIESSFRIELREFYWDQRYVARPHQGGWCYGKTPMRSFLDAMSLTKEK